MPYKQCEYFMFANERSTDYGIINVNMSSGMQEEEFVASRDIKQVFVRGRDKPYFMGIEYKPLTLSVQFAFEDTFDSDKIRSVARWLTKHKYYQPLAFSDNLDKIYYCIVNGDSRLIHNCLSQGYIELTFLCDGPYTYSPFYLSQEYDFSTTSPNVIKFENIGDLDVLPYIKMTKVGNGDISIINTSNEGIEFKFSGLTDGEIIEVDNESEIINTNIPLTYRYGNFNNNYMSLPYGVNYLTVTGNCKIQFKYQFRTIQG